MLYEVIVSNIGCVYRGQDKGEAVVCFNEYVKQSRSGYGRAAGEAVVLYKNQEIIREYFPQNVED